MAPIVVADGAAALACIARLVPQVLRASIPAPPHTFPEAGAGGMATGAEEEEGEEDGSDVWSQLFVQRFVSNPCVIDGCTCPPPALLP